MSRFANYCCVLLLASVTCQLSAQMAPVPTDPFEPTGFAEMVADRGKRADAFDLLDQARRNYKWHGVGEVPFKMELSFTSSGHASVEGSGNMEELWMDPGNWRWTSNFAGIAQVRLATGGELYGSTDPVPLRVQTVRSLVFWPIIFGPQNMLRAANVKIAGEKVRCLLLSGSVPPEAAPRFWVESEYCIDPKTGLLKLASIAPGTYATYDYSNAFSFHGHKVASEITVHQSGMTVLQLRVESIEDATNADRNLLQSTPQLLTQGSTFTLSVPNRFPMPVDPDPGSPAFIQPVIVHAIIADNDGQVLDAEALQTSNRELADAAVEIVRNSAFDPTGLQREVFINVQFHQPQNASVAVFVERVRRVVLVRRERLPRPPRQPRRPIPRSRLVGQAGDEF